MTAKVGAKQVDKLAKSALNTYINNVARDILNNAHRSEGEGGGD